MVSLKTKIGLIRRRDALMAQVKEVWGVGANRVDQARRLTEGDITKKDIPAVQVLAMIVNTQLALDSIELEELENV